MENKLLINTTITDDTININLKGIIDEDVNFDKIKNIKMKKYIFNFQDITLINSCGIREWINFLETINQDSIVIYTNCPQVIIEQINMVHGFIRSNAHVESFYAPYYCEHCDHEKKELIKADQINNFTPPAIRCEKCDNEMDFDAIAKQYFNFLRR